jgi:hypothetical protein
MGRLCVLAILAAGSLAMAQNPTREQKVQTDRERFASDPRWIYNDLDRAFAEARRSGKPLVVVLRCVPCEECVKLDDELLEADATIQKLLDRFVCVRMIATNGLDLSLFQFDTDQSFAVFLLNADRQIYGRFGTRSHRTEWYSDVSLKGLARALEGALDLHGAYPGNRDQLAARRGPAPEFTRPEQFPEFDNRYSARLATTGPVVPSCIHCHQIGDAQRDRVRSRQGLLDPMTLFPYPHPKSLGLILDPDERARVKAVEPGSLAEQAGFQAGDQIERLGGQPLLSIADVQWVLHGVPPGGGALLAEVRRGDTTQPLTWRLPAGWRAASDLSWRASSWGLRRMGTGGLLLETLPDPDRARLRIAPGKMALRVKHVGEYGLHAAAKHAGFHAGDVITRFDGRDDLVRETDLLAHAVSTRRPGEHVIVQVRRGEDTLDLELPMQK